MEVKIFNPFMINSCWVKYEIKQYLYHEIIRNMDLHHPRSNF